ncbi:hypothetical protein KM043_003897 [Ampulex compressa]|nr:hypothetical protein KM043_003897 [Ampulex compressa]
MLQILDHIIPNFGASPCDVAESSAKLMGSIALYRTPGKSFEALPQEARRKNSRVLKSKVRNALPSHPGTFLAFSGFGAKDSPSYGALSHDSLLSLAFRTFILELSARSRSPPLSLPK